jgi:transcriptional regulator with XRE-family HTH domain
MDPIQISPAQCRMARAGLKLTMDETAKLAGVSRITITKFETGKRKLRPDTLAALRHAFETAGIDFIPDGHEGEGIRIKKIRQKSAYIPFETRGGKDT